MTQRIAYTIWVRPPGSDMWTQHMKAEKGIPWVSYRSNDADREAVRVMIARNYCTRVVKIHLPRERDEHITALLADGDTTMYRATP